MASIYELTSEFQLIWNLMEEGNIEEETLKEVLQCTREELADAIEAYWAGSTPVQH